MLTPEQREQRRRGIGSSDIPAIVGVSPYASAIDVYLDKLGLNEERATQETWCGDRAEAFIATLYEERSGNHVCPVDLTHAHPAHPWALATPDRWRDPGGIVEIKLVGARMLHLWADGVETAAGRWRGLPAHVEVQVQWQLEVCDVERADVAALLGGTDFRIYPVERDRARGAELLEHGRRFWQEHVLARVPPPHTAEDARKMLALRYPVSMGDMLPATDDTAAIRYRLAKLHQEQARIADERLVLENRAKALTTNADGVEGCWTWRRASKTSLWRSAVRAMLIEQWDALAARMGDDERAWESVARGLGAERLINEEQGARRRFILTKTKEERDGERTGRAGALPRAEADGSEADLQGALQAPRGAVPDEW